MEWTRRKLIGATVGSVVCSATARAARTRDRTITLCSYGGVFEEAYRRAVIEPFLHAHPRIGVSYYGVMTSAQMLGILRAQRASPQIDVCLLDIMSAKAATDEGLLEVLDSKSMPVIEELSQHAIVPGVAGPAATFVHMVLLYAPGAFGEAPGTWKVLWDKMHDGKIVIQRPPNAVGVAFTLLAGYMAGATDYRSAGDRGVASVAEMARGVLNWDPKPDPYMFIINGNATLGVGWNARAQLYARQSPGRLAALLPREGTIAYMDMITHVRNSPQPEAARQFIAYALGTQAQARFAEHMFYTPTNRNCRLTSEAASRTATPGQIASMLPVSWPDVAQIRERLSQRWRREILLRRG